MRLATYNVEWFSNLFDAENALLDDAGWSGRYDVRRRDQLAALGVVFTALDADAVMIIEAPDNSRRRNGTLALEVFAQTFGLRTRKALAGFHNDTQQEIALLYDPDVLTAVHDPRGDQTGKKGSFEAPRFDSVFRIDLDTDAATDLVKFSKPPLEAAVTTKSGQHLRLIGVHIKSKAPHGARDADEVMRLSIENRRKQLAQCIWLRQRVDEHLDAKEDIMVMGDFNDGPGLDEFEKLFGHSSIEIVLGLAEDVTRRLFDPHARRVLNRRVGAVPATSRFFLANEGRYLQALLDYIMVSPGLKQKSPKWRIWHPFDDPICYKTPELREALLTASDHFPVSIDLDF